MSDMVSYQGLFGETFHVPSKSIGRRSAFPLAEFADRFDRDSYRPALGMFSFRHDYGEVRAFIDEQDYWTSRGRPLRPAPLRYCR